MLNVVKNNQLLNAVRVEVPVTVPLDGGEVLTIARNGDWLLYNDEREFLKVVDEKKFRDDYICL